MKKRNILQELKYLYTGEILAVFLFWFYYATCAVTGDFPGYSITYALACLTIVLVEGAFYWWNCYRMLTKKKALGLSSIAPLYRTLKYFNQAILLIFIPICIISKEITPLVVIGLLIWIFAIIEQINYFSFRLSYYTKSGMGLQVVKPFKDLMKGKAKKSQIAKDIEKYYKI